jgi:glycine betaine/choline ABC-type transport system substrate-binding protein
VRTPLRPFRAVALTLCLALPLLAACGSSGSSGGSGAVTTTVAGSANSVAAKLVLGASPECPQRSYCLLGLSNKYGLHFKQFKPLDVGGPLTVAALKNNSIQVGLLFTTNGQIAANNWVLLQDDKVLQPADNVTPVLNNKIITAYGPQLSSLLNAVSSKLTTEGLTALNKQTDVDKKDPDAVAQQWLDDNSFKVVKRVAKTGPTIVVGSANFTEDVTLADIYADWLQRNGYPVSKKLSIGSREVYFPALKRGEVDLIPDYAGSLLTFIDKNKPATTDPATNARSLAGVLQPLKLTALNYSKAQDINGFVVTKATADRYHLVKISDLGKPAS